MFKLQSQSPHIVIMGVLMRNLRSAVNRQGWFRRAQIIKKCPNGVGHFFHVIENVLFQTGTSLLFQLLVTVLCGAAEFLFDANELVVLGHSVGTAHRTGLDLT